MTTAARKTVTKRTQSRKTAPVQAALFETQKPKSNTKVAPSFERDALGFLINYAKRRKGVSFSAEMVTLAARAKGIEPVDLRSWGAIFIAAQKDGYIARSQDKLFQRAMGHGTLTAGWVGC